LFQLNKFLDKELQDFTFTLFHLYLSVVAGSDFDIICSINCLHESIDLFCAVVTCKLFQLTIFVFQLIDSMMCWNSR